jgi:hypothetical protein
MFAISRIAKTTMFAWLQLLLVSFHIPFATTFVEGTGFLNPKNTFVDRK